MYRIMTMLLALVLTAASAAVPFTHAAAEENTMNITIDLTAGGKPISPYIYGINQYGNQNKYKQVKATAVRQGGNRTPAYNWENNASNAGSDWNHSSDGNLGNNETPGAAVTTFVNEASFHKIPYRLTTLQLAGYVAADKNGSVTEAEAAPSARWNEVVLTKNAPFTLMPDPNDGVVYMDEYVNFIVQTFGDSSSPKGIQGYSLDNEPALWHNTHSRIHPERVTIAELTAKSVEMAKAVKAIDPGAEIFGPSLFGYTAYDHLADDDSSREWEQLKGENGYHWYLDCYLDQMRQASEKAGIRLLDVLDIHYYSESARVSAKDRVQSVRTLYEEGFRENSWIGQWCMENVPILKTVQTSIDKYYPGTKLAITEYNFGGEDVSATIATTEALGCYADAGVYLATLWGGNGYQFAGINLYTNYDKKGAAFGDLLIPCMTDDVSLCSAYAALNSADDSVLTVSMTNKSEMDELNAVVHLNGAENQYTTAAVYAVYGDSSKIQLLDGAAVIEGNAVKVTLPAYCAAMVVLHTAE